MDVFVSYQPWFLQIIKPNILYAIVQYDIQERRRKERSLEEYWMKLENVQKNPTLRHKTANYEKIIYTSEIQLDAFPSYDDMYGFLRSLESQYPVEVLRRTFEAIEKRQFDLLRWIRNNERSIFQLIVMNERGMRRNRNRASIERNWLALSMNKRQENISKAYEKTSIYNVRRINKNKIKRNYNLKIKHNDYNLSVFHKKRHLKTDECAYDFEHRTPEEQQAFLLQIQQNRNNRSNLKYSFKQDWSETIRNLGIDQLSFLQRRNPSTFNPENEFRNKLKIALTNLINLYLIPIQVEQDDIQTLYCENVMMCISYILYEDRRFTDIEGEIIGKGSFAEVIRTLNGSIFKKEDLRIMSEKEKEKENVTKAPLKKYPINSYLSCQALFSFMIQKYLHNLNPSYIPGISDLQFLFEESNSPKTLSFTKMNNVTNKTYSLHIKQILLHPDLYKYSNFIPFIFKIITKICDILIYYQLRCFFVHRDMHDRNVMVNFNLTTLETGETIIDFDSIQVKLIDFALSSIVIPNHSNQLSQFQYTNLRPFWNSSFSNPYQNIEWNKIDLKYFFICLLFYTLLPNALDLNVGKKQPYNEEHLTQLREIENFIKILLNIKDTNGIDYKIRYRQFQTKNCFFGLKRFDIFFKREIMHDILQMNIENENIFYPSICKDTITRIFSF
jgi:hypothetical protein